MHRTLQILGLKFTGLHQCGVKPSPLCALDVSADVVADHQDLLGHHTEPMCTGVEKRARRFTDNERFDTGGISQRGDKRAGVQPQAVLGAPITGHTQGNERWRRLVNQAPEGLIETREGPTLAQVTDNDCRDALVVSLIPTGKTGKFSLCGFWDKQRDRSLDVGLQSMDGSRRWGKDVLGVRFDSHASQFAADRLTGFRCRVGDKQRGDVVRLHPRQRIGGAGNRPLRLVNDTIQIKENSLHERGFHRSAVYSVKMTLRNILF